ncbi:bifunctional adenosylcobinamide kinase/adenosylcobinamide-phosphate guanylyltransferase [Vallitalea okinawensis]|uniref:bifunctional adenosylcobinamide kinase/adenosylcobinamide-phosphate guanylyltransferase n=1 Tax=Vallitalea okinawensis TaxID=2078660 RepID=UPI000CFAE1AD|nr:bifunctional adenosylcobinamide kinase/adenosylcobinamide-phosphate guanylyltransferase [Vallitalea okinawensis]
MGKLILVTGGARSGKSTFAENLIKASYEDVLYIATAIPYDGEMVERIKKHREQRPSKWETYEGYKDLGQVLNNNTSEAVLLDCMTIMVTNLMFDYMGEEDINDCDTELMEKYILEQINQLIDGTRAYAGTTVLVTNEVGSGLVPESKLSRVFRDIAGRVNQRIAGKAEEVYLVVSGIPVRIKGEA